VRVLTRGLVVLILALSGCPLPPPCLPGGDCPPTPAMEQSCADSGGSLEMIDCAEDGGAAWACCYPEGGCVCFEAEGP